MLARTKRDLYEIARLVVLISGALALAVVFHRMILKGPDAQIRKFKTAALFEAIDANADGRILIEEFSATHEEPFVQVWLRSLVDNSFWYERRVPESSSYILDPINSGNWSMESSIRLGSIFKSIDANEDGQVTEDELFRWVSVKPS
ncbi:MAG: hypothetical protein CMF06_15765 [Hyphomonas sp.]|nr:hypothetical protein [Hyphomonas sp.]MBM58385.1 hypothetical protein [Hyphomonas sp.]|tara:strand:- start:122 stop:562 length:441 start_codon:yes stop_codon:yes gene_type:complete